ncbi:MAG TPA: glycosyltransferase family 4 protein [Candidatus Dormibacteraeota bacterium]|nr:glycosyltransferase family 4 protein [Candidatus Dormibacteraeota bacterium]
MRLLRKAVITARTRGVVTMLAMAARKVARSVDVRRDQAADRIEALAPFSVPDPYQPDTVPRPHLRWQASEHLRLRWYVPEPGRGSGGHQTLFRLVHLLGQRGHDSEVAVLHGEHVARTRGEMRRFVREQFGADAPVVWDTDEHTDVDVVLASSWQTAYAITADVRCALRAYVVQDWEPDFYPRGAEQILAENSYRLGHAHIAAGPWLAARLQGIGVAADVFHLGADQVAYYPSEEPRPEAGQHVVFYARPFTARRCFELGCEALRLLDLALGPGRLTVSMVGAGIRPFPTPYRARWLGVLPPAELRRLYAGADAVLVLSATNPSLVPLEAALCAAPVVDLRVPSAEGTFEDGVTGVLAPPSPGGLAAALRGVLEDPAAARALGRRARQHALTRTWDAAAETVERHLLAALRRAAGAPALL